MGRTPFSKENEEKNSVGLKKGPWSADEDQKLIAYIRRYGIWNWTHMPKPAGLARSGKSCRLRWLNYLRPNLKHGNISEEEEEAIIKWHRLLGNRWSAIASKLPGRTDNEIKNYWNTRLKRRGRSEKSMQAPSAGHPDSQVAVAPPINTTLVKNDQPNILESSSLKTKSGLGKIIPGALGFEETSQRSSPMGWIDNEVGVSVEGRLGLDFWENIVLPPVEDLSMEEDLKAMFIVSSGFELPKNYSHSEFSTDGYLVYDNLWENW